MVPRGKISRKAMKSNVTPLDKARHRRAKVDVAGAMDVCEFIGAMAAELAELAYMSRLDTLAVACDVVREIAEGKVNSQSRQVDCG